jgi:beta-glucosidase
VERVASTGVPVVVVVLSGRPMILGSVLERAPAVVAAWLPGTEGAGVADVLFGDSAPRGKLSHSWPRTMADIPVNVGDAGYAPLFPFGFGLSYSPAAAPQAPSTSSSRRNRSGRARPPG